MRNGGNDNLNAFLKQYGIDKSTEIKLKYNSKAAEFFREKIRASVTGAAYSPPPPDASNSVRLYISTSPPSPPTLMYV